MAGAGLRKRLARMIAHSGPMSLAEFMHVAMSDPVDGYYNRKPAIGSKGDFITAPETSQLFGEMIAIWCVSAWYEMGSPGTVALVEAGPGNGTLMADLLRSARNFPDFLSAIHVHLVETSPAMMARQRERLSGLANDIHWHASMEAVPPIPMLFIANELLDVMPIRQYVKSGRNWLENCVGLDGAGKLAFTLGAGQIDPALLPEGHQLEPDGAVFEISPAREAFILELCERLKNSNGAALLIDYGHSASGFGDTFQALRTHTYANALAEPGQADLTSHVDFAPLTALARATTIAAAPICSQGDFLLAMGLLQRAGILGANADAARREQIRGEVQRLAGPDEMGNLFKVMGLWHCTDRPIPDLPPFHMPKTEH
ncbi:MAG: class I SAM-dependent methyltransferase [Nitratireductor sp.]